MPTAGSCMGDRHPATSRAHSCLAPHAGRAAPGWTATLPRPNHHAQSRVLTQSPGCGWQTLGSPESLSLQTDHSTSLHLQDAEGS